MVPAVTTITGVGAVVALLLGKEDSVWTGVLFVFFFALSETGNVATWAIIGDFFGRKRFATLRGGISLVQAVVALPSATFAGWVYDRTSSYFRALVPVALFYLLASLPYWTLQRPRRPTVSQPVETKPL